MKLISRKKDIFPVNQKFDRYLRYFGRGYRLPVHYDELLSFSEAFSLYDKNGNDTLWKSVSYDYSQRDEICDNLLKVYAFLRADGDMSLLRHLEVDRVDLCMYGNTKPFRVRIINRLNDNFDYFYVKQADASRLYGLELEHILSPNRIGFMFFEDTLIEDHIHGIPGDVFLSDYIDREESNQVRIAKEFVKFNERCFLRLLGDMHAANFVVDVTMDFEENFYRLKAIDFDQQSYEGRKKVYLPQFFPQNATFVQTALSVLSQESIIQYQKEERSLIKKRMISSGYRLSRLLDCMKADRIAPFEHVTHLRKQLAEHHRDSNFLEANSMGALVEISLSQVHKKIP